VDGTGSGSCVVVGFGISGVETLCSAIRELVSNIDRTLDAINLPVQPKQIYNYLL
jgi:hypothetical protein